MDAPPLPRSYFSSWSQGSGSLDVIMQSAPTSTDPQLIDHARITFQQHNKGILIGAPPEMENVVDITSPIHETWLEGRQGFASFQQTVAGQAISAYIHSTPYLPQSLQDYFTNAIFSEAEDSARMAASQERRAVRMDFHLDISIDMMFDDDYDSSAEDGEDVAAGNVEVDAEMGSGDAGVDAVTANAEEDAAFALVEIQPMAGNDAVQPVEDALVEIQPMAGNDAVLPVDLEAAEVVAGLSPEAIANHLTVDNFMGGDPAPCVICLQNISRGTPAGWLPCGHVFHPWCVTEWLRRSGTCPICRHQLPDIGG